MKYLDIFIPSKNEICSLTCGHILNLQSSSELKNIVENITVNFPMGQSDLPKFRSEILTDWYKNANSERCFLFIDSDQTFTPTDVVRCLKYGETYDVVCGLYSKKDGSATSIPEDVISFYTEKEGKIKYGATGFMLINFNIVDKIAKYLGYICQVSSNRFAIPFFYERIIQEETRKNIWLSEDFSFSYLVNLAGGTIWGFISPTIGHIIPSEKFLSSLDKCKKWSDKSIVYMCNPSVEKWNPKSKTKGIGGSEQAVIELTKYWVKFGYEVTVYCSCDEVGNYDGVEYKNINDINPLDIFNILIIWRDTQTLDFIKFKANKVILDLHDVVKKLSSKLLENVDKICVKSVYHSKMLGCEDENKFIVIPNGGKINEDYVNEHKKDPNYIIYSSSYDRGLEYMLKWGWPIIKKKCPDAYLNIYYGWNVFDKSFCDNKQKQNFKKSIIELMKQDGVKEYGRISHELLLKEKEKASIHYYVGSFSEIDCISVRESASLGVIPVVSESQQVFKEKDYCVLIEGDPKIRETQEKGAEKIVEILNNLEENKKAIKVPETETWENVAKKWIEIFEK